ncbi:transcription factor Ovo-like 2 [Uloborus diversus]|uniref:transcription factor Ovo-like 2 n=1 Tax=Uloborus diversus TaxID=327109 RepID=UPI0024092EE6|nr:transcription factor Ovo-like 2 [Uloborus diversus]
MVACVCCCGVCTNDFAADWVHLHFNGRTAGDSELAVLPFKDLVKPVKIAFKTRDIYTLEQDKVMKRLARLNTSSWRARDETVVKDNYVRWIFEVDSGLAEFIKKSNLELFVGGFGKGLCKILHDPNTQNAPGAETASSKDSDVSLEPKDNVEAVETPAGSNVQDPAKMEGVETSVDGTPSESTPTVCSTCGKTFTLKKNLNQHVKTHLAVKLFSCEECNKTFTRKGDLNRHKMTHLPASAPIALKCKDCDMTFTRLDNLRRHERAAHG